MSKPMPPSPLRQEDYLAIEAAVMETARGRWFLSEFARQNRNSDTDTLLAAIDKLEKNIVQERAPSSLMKRVKMDLADMAAAIEKTKQEIAQIKHEDNDGAERFERASSELDAIVSQTETATGDILGAAEKIQEYAWTMREQGADGEHCDALDMEATNIYMACSFQDLTGQRIKKIVDAMRYVETRINSMIDIWGFESHKVEVDVTASNPDDERPDAHLLNGPALEGEGIDQGHVDSLLDHSHAGVDAVESNQDDVDALFDTASTDVDIDSSLDSGFASVDFDGGVEADEIMAEAGELEMAEPATMDLAGEAAPHDSSEAEMLQTDVSTLLDDMSFDAVETEETAEAEVVEPVIEEAVQAAAVEEDYEFVDLDDLDWAEAAPELASEPELETGLSSPVAEPEPASEMEADNIAAADMFAAPSEAFPMAEPEMPAMEGDILASEPVEATAPASMDETSEADVFAVADLPMADGEASDSVSSGVAETGDGSPMDAEADVFSVAEDPVVSEFAADEPVAMEQDPAEDVMVSGEADEFSAVEEAMQKELDEQATRTPILKDRIADFS